VSGELCVPSAAVALRTGAVLRSTTAGAWLATGFFGGVKTETGSGIVIS
jgi:hypothetical protein